MPRPPARSRRAARLSYLHQLGALASITRQVGGADVKLAVLTSMLPRWLGWNHFMLALISGLLLAALTAGALITTRRISRRDPRHWARSTRC